MDKYQELLDRYSGIYLEEWLKKNTLSRLEGESGSAFADRFDEHTERGKKAVERQAEEVAQWEYLRWKCLTDLYFLGSEILGLKNAVAGNGRHRLDESLHRQMAEELQREEDTLQLYPRNHMKSTWLKILAVQLILRNPNVRIGMWSKTTKLARKELRSIKAHLKNKLLRQLFPEYLSGKFAVDNADQVVCWRAENTSVQEAQIEVWGIESTVVGHHYDYHLYDDIIDQDSVTSASKITAVLDWWEYMQAIKDLGAIEKIVGTRYHLRDIYGYILHENLFEPENVIIRSAIEGGKPIYSFYRLADLAKLKKKMGDKKFASQMQNQPVAAADKIFNPPYLLYDVMHAPRREERKYYIAIDPAATVKQYSNKSGISVGFVDRNNPSRLMVEESYGVEMRSDDLAGEIVRQIIQYRPYAVGIELGLQQALMPLISLKISEWEREHQGEFLSPNWVEISTGNTAKAIKLERVLGAMLRDDRVLFPAIRHGELLVHAKQMDALFLQMDMYNPNTDANEDDIVDGLNMLIQTIEHFSAGNWFNVNRSNGPQGLTREYIMKHYMGQGQNKDGWERKFA